MKKIIMLIITFAMLVSLSSCNNISGENNSKEKDQTAISQDKNPKEYAVKFADTAFERYTREMLGKLSGDILNSDISTIKRIKLTWATYEAFSISYLPMSNSERKWISIDAIMIGEDKSDMDSYLIPKSFEDLQHFKGLEYLQIDSEIRNISFTKELHDLVYISLRGASFADISSLRNCKKLTFLSLTDGQIFDLSPLKDLNELQTLNLRDNAISDLSPLSDLQNLKEIDISQNPITDVSPLAKLPSLKKVYANSIEADFSALTSVGIKVLDDCMD